MQSQGSTAPRHKSFTYNVKTTWSHEKIGAIDSDGKPTVTVASPPEFKGTPGLWTPEDLFVAAIDVCQMTTFLAFSSRAGIPVRAYQSAATGTLEFTQGGYRFTTVTLLPKITVEQGTDLKAVERTVHEAHASCLIGRSVSASITVVPEIVTEE